ncbi:uncharacterized protein LOC111632732 [Centruroides sculpturatus]|uniref:uncharacterized protein LOC111632732 n=1 Tax=Centruroides sculpturatus TaxID=218467 RepID=UPI000C6E4F69|nr:uncharacterized protein LOC111632732 [Centruroides sculpturatus]
MNTPLTNGNNITSLTESINHIMIKQKIIQTDKVIKQYSFKCKENEVQKRKLDSMDELLEQLRKDCTKYENELSQVLQELEPLKSKWTALKDENSKQVESIKLLEEKLSSTDKLVKEYNSQLRIRREERSEQARKKNRDIRKRK